MIRKTLIALCSLALFSACDNDLDITAEWKDIPVVYGIINVEDTTHYIKFNRAFLGQGNVYEMAQEFDSTNYNPSVMGLRLLELSESGGVLNTVQFHATDEFDKPEGIFSSPSQIIYKSYASLNAQSEYAVEAYNKVTDSIIAYSKQPVMMVKPLQIIRPNSLTAMNIIPNMFPAKVEWNSVAGGQRYQLKMRFSYVEIQVEDQTDTTHKYIEWVFPKASSLNLDGGESMSTMIDSEQFLSFIAANIDEDPNVYRQVVGVEPSGGNSIQHSCLEFYLDAAGEELSTYIELEESSGSIVTERPEYTNILYGNDEDARGILSSRSSDEVLGVKISNATNDNLSSSDYTKHLNFAYFILNGNNEIEARYH